MTISHLLSMTAVNISHLYLYHHYFRSTDYTTYARTCSRTCARNYSRTYARMFIEILLVLPVLIPTRPKNQKPKIKKKN